MAPDNREGGDITAADMVLPEEEPSDIQKFYKDSTIFITGATGYLGKLILEKLLRSCPDLNHIYILLREKKGKDREKRFQEIFDVPVSQRTHNFSPSSTSFFILDIRPFEAFESKLHEESEHDEWRLRPTRPWTQRARQARPPHRGRRHLPLCSHSQV